MSEVAIRDDPAMRISQLIQGYGLAVTRGDAERVPTDLADDSRRVTPGSLFIARAGAGGSGEAYIGEAVRAGAAAVLAPDGVGLDLPESITLIHAREGVAVDHALTSRLAERFFGEPSSKLSLLGVTGTNGKTTVAYLVRHLLAAAEVRCGLIGTIEIDDGVAARPAELTTPGPIDVSRRLAAMVDHGCRAAAMEVSSHALHQGRTAGLNFHAAAFTNLTGDHLDYHGTLDAYAAAKAKLFEQVGARGWAVINADDAYAVRMLDAGRCRVLWTTLDEALIADARAHAEADRALSFAYARALEMQPTGSRTQFTGPWGSLELTLPLIGKHNIANALQAAALAGTVIDVSRTLRQALETCPQIPGRLERVTLPETTAAQSGGSREDLGERNLQIPTVLVDYAHTHDALKNVLTALRPVTPGRLIALIGCGGDRDKTKRPRMARLAADLADVVWITSDNPRSEDPDAIIDDMLEGISDLGCPIFDWRQAPQSNLEHRAPKIHVLPDRAVAIEQCLLAAAPGETVLLAGKGHEDYQIVADPDHPGQTIKTHFDDREHAAAALRLWRQNKANPPQTVN
jgi:UDP-N-acetylmuramoyl-L-alanyl-D-glutamate--2,6-diaminopimelate ligase